MTTGQQQLTELVAAMTEAGIMPEEIDYGNGCYWYGVPKGRRSSLLIRDNHALYILCGTAEDWLRGKGWNSISPGEVFETEWEHEPSGTWYLPLPAAIRAEMERSNDPATQP